MSNHSAKIDMNLMKMLFWVTLIAFLQIQTHASVTINVGADTLRDATGTPIPVGTGLIMLVADRDGNGFAGPANGAFVSGDDFEIARWSISGGVPATAGKLSAVIGPANYITVDPSGTWGSPDPLKLFWFPTLRTSDATPHTDDAYGSFRDTDTSDGSDLWISPADGSTIGLLFLTASGSGSWDNALGNASSLVPIPEPWAYGVAFGGLCLAGAIVTRRFRKRQA